MKTIVLLFIISLNLVQAQEETKITLVQKAKNIFKNNRVGLTYSMMSGYGLTYLRAFENNFSLKTQLFAYGNLDNSENSLKDNSVNFAIGTELQYNLTYFKNNRLYTLAGFYFDYDYATSQENVASFVVDTYDIKRKYNFGLGIGFEAFIANNITIALDGGYYGYFENRNSREIKYDKNEARLVYPTSNAISFGFGFGASLYYNF